MPIPTTSSSGVFVPELWGHPAQYQGVLETTGGKFPPIASDFVLGISMFMTQRLSMATMDKSQKPMMYIMSAFFFLLFNSFPSGLNLYYTVYNFLNYFQQKSIKAK